MDSQQLTLTLAAELMRTGGWTLDFDFNSGHWLLDWQGGSGKIYIHQQLAEQLAAMPEVNTNRLPYVWRL